MCVCLFACAVSPQPPAEAASEAASDATDTKEAKVTGSANGARNAVANLARLSINPAAVPFEDSWGHSNSDFTNEAAASDRASFVPLTESRFQNVSNPQSLREYHATRGHDIVFNVEAALKIWVDNWRINEGVNKTIRIVDIGM